jgi:hypothetical protein
MTFDFVRQNSKTNTNGEIEMTIFLSKNKKEDKDPKDILSINPKSQFKNPI